MQYDPNFVVADNKQDGDMPDAEMNDFGGDAGGGWDDSGAADGFDDAQAGGGNWDDVPGAVVAAAVETDLR